MQFFNRRAIFAYVLILSLVALMTGCGGGGGSSSKAAATVTEVDIIPSPSISMQPGDIVPLFAQALNSSGSQVFTQTITFSSSNPAMQIGTQVGAQNGQALLCAGTWDNASNPVVCHPFVYPTPVSNPPPVVASNITASAGGVTSATTVANIHIAVASITVVPQITPPLVAIPPCVSEGKTQIYKAVAKDISGNDITATVGKFTWQSSQTNVATIPVTGDTGVDDQATATAVHPGDSNITAQVGSVNPVKSTTTVFEQCLVNSIVVSVGTPSSATTPPEDATHFTVNTGASRALTVTVTDTSGAPVTTLPALSWNTTHPAIATVAGTSTGANVAGVAPGTVGISASCLPNNCNIGTNANVTSNLVSGTVNGTPSTTANAYVTCTDPTAGGTCNTGTLVAPQVKLFPISGTTLGTALTLNHVPNSMVISPGNSRIYLGSTPNTNDTSAGLMIVDAAANTFTGTVASAPGKVLAVAPNGNGVVTSNNADVFLYNGSTAVPLLIGAATHITNATAAAFSPDSGKLIIATSGGEAVFEVPGATPTVQPSLGTLVGAAFYPSGSLQGASTAAATHVFDTANTSAGSPPACGGVIQPLPNVDALYAADPAGGTVCVISNTLTITSNSLGALPGNSILIDPSGTLAYFVGNNNAVKVNTIGSGTVATITLSGGDIATTAGIATNGTLYVGAVNGATNSVHVIAAGLPVNDTTTPIVTTIPADLVVAKH